LETGKSFLEFSQALGTPKFMKTKFYKIGTKGEHRSTCLLSQLLREAVIEGSGYEASLGKRATPYLNFKKLGIVVHICGPS
jgi:hypothetical protein